MAQPAEKRDTKATADQGRGLQLGRSARPRRRTDRGRAHGARHRARLCAGEAVSARAQGLSRRELRSGRDPRNGRARAARPDHPGGIWRRRPRLCGLRADRARDRARRFRLPLGDVGAVVAGDAPDLRLWQRSAAAQISAQARDRRDCRLLRPHRARPRLRSRLDDHARREGRRRLSAQRRENVDHQFAGGRHRRRVGEARRQDPRLRRRARHQGLFDAEDRGQAFACAPPSPARSCSRTRSCRKKICCPTSAGLPARSAASTSRAPASPGARSAPPNSAGIAPATMCSTASNSAGRSPPTSSSRKSSPTCRPRSRSACTRCCGWRG